MSARRKGGIRGGVHQALAHESARKHVAGDAVYIDDMPEPPGLLHAAFGLSPRAHARIREIDLGPVRGAPGVVAVMAAADIPGANNVGPVIADEPVFADGTVHYVGQCLFAVAADSMEAARRAALLARIAYDDLEPVLSIDEALARDSFVLPPHEMRRGNPRRAIAGAPHRLSGRLEIGGQDHFYLEGQIAMAVPGEDGDMTVYSSTQHPSETQHLVAAALGRSSAEITVEVRRMGGAFGGKETQGALFAAIAALLADRTGRPVKARADRDDDMVMTGKRHAFRIDWQCGFDDSGRIDGIVFDQAVRCGISADLSGAIADRAMFHADNAYYLDNVRIGSVRCRTNTVSDTAFRGFGGPQGMMGMEQVIDSIARHLDLDPLDVRRANLYGGRGRDETPYGMKVTDNILPEILDDLEKSSRYRARRKAIRAFNRRSPVLKRGLALTPVKFGISFTTMFLNQAGALVHVYTDGSIHLNHGGTEMGQGLFTKVAQIVAEEFAVDVDRISITATSTGKVPNTSATAASSGTDINGAAARIAARKIRDRLAGFAARTWGGAPDAVVFRDNHVHVGRRRIPFADVVRQAYLDRVQLSATGFFRTPDIWYDRARAHGRPFRYFAYGAAVSEVLVDTLTGENRVLRVDILHDCGRSINPAVDIGQIEGGFVQGMGWLTMEELWWDGEGRLMTHAPSTYKIPVASDVPDDFRVRILESGRNREEVIHRSKAVGEPPLMLAISVFQAIRDAVASVGERGQAPDLDAPATPERILASVDELRRRNAADARREAAE